MAAGGTWSADPGANGGFCVPRCQFHPTLCATPHATCKRHSSHTTPTPHGAAQGPYGVTCGCTPGCLAQGGRATNLWPTRQKEDPCSDPSTQSSLPACTPSAEPCCGSRCEQCRATTVGLKAGGGLFPRGLVCNSGRVACTRGLLANLPSGFCSLGRSVLRHRKPAFTGAGRAARDLEPERPPCSAILSPRFHQLLD